MGGMYNSDGSIMTKYGQTLCIINTKL